MRARGALVVLPLLLFAGDGSDVSQQIVDECGALLASAAGG